MRLNCVNILKMPGLARPLWVQASGGVSARQPSFSVKDPDGSRLPVRRDRPNGPGPLPSGSAVTGSGTVTSGGGEVSNVFCHALEVVDVAVGKADDERTLDEREDGGSASCDVGTSGEFPAFPGDP